MTATERITFALEASLQRLDQILGAAVERAAEVYGPAASRDLYRGLYIDAEEFERVLAQAPGQPVLWIGSELYGGPPGFAAEFGLSGFDLDVLLIASAPELDLKYERLFGYLQDDVTRKRPTVDLALNLLCPSAESRIVRRAHFSPDAPLLASGMLRLVADPTHADPPLLAHYLKPEEQALALLTGQQSLDRRLAPFCRLVDPRLSGTETALSPEVSQAPEVSHALIRFAQLAGNQNGPLRLYFEGPPGAGQEEAAEALARECGSVLLAADVDRAVEFHGDLETLLPVLFREARLRHAVLFIEGAESLPQKLLESLVEARAGVTIASGGRAHAPWFPVSFRALGAEDSRWVWKRAAAVEGLDVSGATVKTLSARLRLTHRQIHNAVRTARCHATWRGAAKTGVRDLMAAARANSGQDLAAVARKMTPRHGWDDIVLPPDTEAQLRELCQRVEHRHRVLEGWGFERKLSMGKGVNSLFSGPSGSGKTMAAEVISTELDLDAYKIDLSGVISKYIGETEKNLDRIFAAAENANAILFFDEADALFGKRSEVRDSHDRYANIEISYLLQKMEEYSGVAILATNLRQNLDDAFVRRLTFSVHFPFPDEAARTRIWQGIWPASVPLASDVDSAALARRFKLSGGNIRNVALAAAFLAAVEGQSVSMEHVLHAVRREFQKFGRQLQPGELQMDHLERAAS